LIHLLKSLNIPIPSELKDQDPLRVLIVEDNDSTRRLLRRIIARAFPGIELHEAADGFEAGRKMTTIRPAVIVLDIFLPGLDGFALCKKLRSDAELKHVKVLAVSGEHAEETGRKAIASGADVFFPRPFEAKAIEATLRKWLPPQAPGERVGEQPGFILREKANG